MEKKIAPKLAVIVHGGAGKTRKEHAEKKVPVMQEARDRAWELLQQGVPGEEAVAAALKVMEADEYFNAGYGGFPNEDGVVLLDAAIMKGETRQFAAYVNMRRFKYPSEAVLDLLRKGGTLLSIWTRKDERALDASDDEKKARYGWVKTHDELIAAQVQKALEEAAAQHDTVGCVVRDARGSLFAGTSTGGLERKVNGRIGDSPIVGCGLYADNELCGLSVSGHGESILLSMLSGFVVCEMRRALQQDKKIFLRHKKSLDALLKREIHEMERKAPGKGAGIIVIPSDGNPAYAFCSEQFSVAYRYADCEKEIREAFVAGI